MTAQECKNLSEWLSIGAHFCFAWLTDSHSSATSSLTLNSTSHPCLPMCMHACPCTHVSSMEESWTPIMYPPSRLCMENLSPKCAPCPCWKKKRNSSLM